MRAGDLHLTLEPGRKGPLYMQVAATILEAVRERRILPGVALPGVRDLADRLGVTVNTILAALRALQDQGWLTSQERSGFFVADPLPELGSPAGGPGGAPAGAAPGYDLPAHLQPITSAANVLMDLTDGLADSRLAPSLALGRAYQRGLKLKGPKLLGASDFKGLLRLREALAEHLKTQRAILAGPEQILILRSTTMTVGVVAQALVGPAGGAVAVENPGNPLVWEALRQAGAANLVALPVDEAGACAEALERSLDQGAVPPRLVVLTPQCQFPTGVGLSEARRAKFLELARRHRFAILELDPEFDYLPVLGSQRPLASVDAGQVIYAGSLSRILAPGIRVSYVVAPEPLAGLLARARQAVDWQGDPVQEWALAELILDGELQRQLLRVRKAAAERREALEDALRHALAATLDFDPGHGSMALWLRGAGRLADPAVFTLWIRACQSRGLKLRAGRHYDLEGRDRAATRLGFTGFTPEELQRAVALMS
jgi:GntR family transcriptional regulator/MocR family aminotransferase